MLSLSNLGLHSTEQQWGRVNTKSYQEKQYLKRSSTYVWFFNHIKFSINLKIRKRTHQCIQCLYNTILRQWFGGVCHPFLWWFISLNSNFQKSSSSFCELQNRWLWWFLKFLRGNLFSCFSFQEYEHPQSTGICSWSSSHEQNIFWGICHWWAWCSLWWVPKQHKTKTIWTFTPFQLCFGQATSCLIKITFTESSQQRCWKKWTIVDETLFFAKLSLRNSVAFFILCKICGQTGTQKHFKWLMLKKINRDCKWHFWKTLPEARFFN